MANEHLQRCLASGIMKIYIKTKMECQHIATTNGQNFKIDMEQVLVRIWGNWNCHTLLVGI